MSYTLRCRLPIACLLALLVACVDQPTETSSPDMAAEDRQRAEEGQKVYNVLFTKDVREPRPLAEMLVRTHGGAIRGYFEHGNTGFSALLREAAASAFRNHPSVAFVEENKHVVTTDHAIQGNATWGLDRIDQRDLPLSTTYVYTTNGSGVNVYIIDTGIRMSHAEFQGRAGPGFDAFGGTAEDCHGHGTHVAATAGGATYGVAKNVRLFSVRVLGCAGGGTTEGLNGGIDWVIGNHEKPAVANMSIGIRDSTGRGTIDPTVDTKVQNLIDAGVTVVISAGNENRDACEVSPAHVAPAITTGASTNTDSRWTTLHPDTGSNFGTCVDLFAPGRDITSADIGSDTDARLRTGTSMAAPHTSGIAALYLQAFPSASTTQVTTHVLENTTLDRLGNVGAGSPNRLAHSNPLLVSIAGPTRVTAEGTYTWEAMPSGGFGGYTYQWWVTWVKTLAKNTLGTGKTQSLGIDAEDGDFVMEVQVTSLISRSEKMRNVSNQIPGTCRFTCKD